MKSKKSHLVLLHSSGCIELTSHQLVDRSVTTYCTSIDSSQHLGTYDICIKLNFWPSNKTAIFYNLPLWRLASRTILALKGFVIWFLDIFLINQFSLNTKNDYFGSMTLLISRVHQRLVTLQIAPLSSTSPWALELRLHGKLLCQVHAFLTEGVEQHSDGISFVVVASLQGFGFLLSSNYNYTIEQP